MSNLQERIDQLTPEQKELLLREQLSRPGPDGLPQIVLPLKGGDIKKRVPIFCFHPLHGGTGYYINFARFLPADQAVYGIQAPALYGLGEPLDRIEEMAQVYGRAVRQVQPNGPYILLGHSCGAHIAYELAMQLQRVGESVPLLVLVDESGPLLASIDALSDELATEDLSDSVVALALLVWSLGQVQGKSANLSVQELAALPKAQQIVRVADALREIGFLRPDEPAETVLTIAKIASRANLAQQRYRRAMTQNRPNDRFTGTTLLLRCTEGTRYPGYDVEQPPDTSEYSLWESFCNGPRHLVGVPGSNHVTIVAEPYAQAIADRMEPFLQLLATQP